MYSYKTLEIKGYHHELVPNTLIWQEQQRVIGQNRSYKYRSSFEFIRGNPCHGWVDR